MTARAPIPGYTPPLAPDVAPVPSALHPPLEGADRVLLVDHAAAKHTRQSSADAASYSGWMYATEPEIEPWWEIDLGTPRYVEHLLLWLAPAPPGTEVRVVAHAIHTPKGAPAGESPVWQAQMGTLPVESEGSSVLPITIDTVARFFRVSLRHAGGERVALLVRGARILGSWLFAESLLASYARAFTLFADRPLFCARPSPGEGSFEVTHRYRDVWTAARHLASALAGVLEPDPGGERVFLGLCTRNRAEWIVADLAAVMRGYVVVPLSPDDADDKLAGILERCPLTAVLAEGAGGARFVRLAARFPSIRLVVTCPPDAAPEPGAGAPVCATFAEMVARGEALAAAPAAPRGPDDLYTLGFTSGSSGVPKGAMRRYSTFLAMVKSYGVAQPAVHLSFQPLSHLSERMYMPAVILQGGLIGFSGGGAHVLSDLRALEPSDVGSVPRLFELALAGHRQRLAVALAASPGEPRDEVEARVLRETRGVFGSRLQILSVGSAPCSPEVFAFLQRCFGDVWVSDGYGSTECGTITANGLIQANVDVKLVPVAALAEGEAERGEIWVRTPHMIDGYYNDPEASRASRDADGYFATGDLGERLPGGGVRVVGRVKNVIKLGQGEFVAVDRVEAELASCPLVDQIFVSPDASSSALLAVVVPRFEALGTALGAPGAPPADLAARPDASLLLVRVLGEHGRRAGLASFELPRAVLVEAQPMTAASGLLTASGKLSRPAAAAHFAAKLAALGREVPPPAAGDALAERLAAVVGGVVGRRVDPAEPLHAGGMAVDSLVAAEVLSAAAATLGREIPLRLWFEARSVEDLAHRLDRGALGARRQVDELPAKDMALELPRPPAGAEVGRVPFETVVLTGATGLLGAHLLESLAARTRARVVCLVRAASDEAAAERVRATLDRYRIPCPEAARWTAVAADLAAPGLGMDPARRLALAGEADVILHAGAEVSWIHPYEKLRAPNVLGTLGVLALATAVRTVPVHFVSTISTAPADGDETSMLRFEQVRAGGGYGLTKWIAEHLVRRAAADGHPAAVYRPAMIAGHSVRGHGNPEDYVNRYLRACVTSGRYLDLREERLDMTPADFVADGIVALMTAHPQGGKTYHLTNVRQSMTYRALGEAMASAGYACAPAAYEAFVEAAVKPQGSPLKPLASYFPAGGFGLGMGPWPCNTTREVLAALGVACPPVDERLVAAYLAGLSARGAIPVGRAST